MCTSPIPFHITTVQLFSDMKTPCCVKRREMLLLSHSWLSPSPMRVRALCCGKFTLYWLKSIATMTEEPVALPQEGARTALKG